MVSIMKRALAGWWESKPEPGARPLPALDLGEGSREGQPGPNYLSAPDLASLGPGTGKPPLAAGWGLRVSHRTELEGGAEARLRMPRL